MQHGRLIEETTLGMMGAIRLAVGRADGLELIAADRAGARRSFVVVLLLGPIAMLEAASLGNPLDGLLLDRMIIGLLLSLISWFGFLLVAARVADWLETSAQFAQFVAAYNWALGVQAVVALLLLMIKMTGLVPGDGLLDIIFLAWTLFYTWIVAAIVLDISDMAAIHFSVAKLAVAIIVLVLAVIVAPELMGVRPGSAG